MKPTWIISDPCPSGTSVSPRICDHGFLGEYMNQAYANADLQRLTERLQTAVNEKQEAMALQSAYYSKLKEVQEESKLLRAHVSFLLVDSIAE